MGNKHGTISLIDREQILKLVAKGLSQRKIAKEIGKHQSSISRELRRDGMNRNTYSISIAQVDRNRRSSQKGAKPKLFKGGKLLRFVKEKLISLRWSPEQISGYLKRDGRMNQISYETIYRYIYSIKDSSEKGIWIKSLRQKQKKRRSRKAKTEKRGKIPNRVSIHERSSHINERIEGGHWEGDTVVGKNHASAIGTVVERTSRFTIIVNLPNEKTSIVVAKEFSKELINIPLHLRKSLTYDNGHEMSRHELLTEMTGMEVFFADPGCPGQRGTNENTNGLIRDFFPKGTDFNKVSGEELKGVQKLLNERPRKVLGFITPAEKLRKLIKKGDDPPDTKGLLNGKKSNSDLVRGLDKKNTVPSQLRKEQR